MLGLKLDVLPAWDVHLKGCSALSHTHTHINTHTHTYIHSLIRPSEVCPPAASAWLPSPPPPAPPLSGMGTLHSSPEPPNLQRGRLWFLLPSVSNSHQNFTLIQLLLRFCTEQERQIKTNTFSVLFISIFSQLFVANINFVLKIHEEQKH